MSREQHWRVQYRIDNAHTAWAAQRGDSVILTDDGLGIYLREWRVSVPVDRLTGIIVLESVCWDGACRECRMEVAL